MKKIGISQRVDEISNYGEKREALDIKWIKLLDEVDIIPVPLSAFGKSLRLFDSLDGFILTGGNDPKVAQKAISPCEERDKLEISIINHASKTRKPLLGICRGMLMLSLYYGSIIKKCKNHVAVKHKVNVMEEFYEYKNIQIKNSYHSQAVFDGDLNKQNLKVMALCSDGVVEAIKHKFLPQVGLMWHPERENKFLEIDKFFLRKFFNER